VPVPAGEAVNVNGERFIPDNVTSACMGLLEVGGAKRIVAIAQEGLPSALAHLPRLRGREDRGERGAAVTVDVLRIVQLDPGTERWLGFARQKARAFIQEIHAKASSAKPPDGFTKTIRPEQGVTIHLIGSYHGTDWIVKVFVVGGGSATFFHNENGSPSFDDYDFSDQHVASECVRGGLFVQKPAHRRYPIEALAKLLAAKRWGIAWFWCNTYFAAEGVPCAYLKTGWEASTVGTDVLVVDAGKVIGWDFYDSDYPPHDRLNSEEEQEHFATPITAEEVTALLGPFLGEFVSDEGDFFPDGGAFPTPTLPSGAISFVEDATGELPMPPITLESKRWWRLPHADGPYDHDGEYIVGNHRDGGILPVVRAPADAARAGIRMGQERAHFHGELGAHPLPSHGGGPPSPRS
jgi:hypothetical protein